MKKIKDWGMGDTSIAKIYSFFPIHKGSSANPILMMGWNFLDMAVSMEGHSWYNITLVEPRKAYLT